jgi:short-subunit dehydrogenase
MSNTSRPLAFVTGGTSGIGFALAAQLAEHGHDVAISGSSDRVHSSAERLRKRGVEAWSHRADAGTYDGVESFWCFVEAVGRPVAVAVLNVGIATSGSFADTALDDHLKVLAINVTGTTHMAKRVVDHMIANGSGRILIVSSISATTPTPYEGVYGATKAFGYSLAESLREELREHGINVTALLPGATDSDFHTNAGMGEDTPIGRLEKFPREEVARLGYEGLMAGDDMVFGGGDDAREALERNRTTPEPVKAAAHARLVRRDR